MPTLNEPARTHQKVTIDRHIFGDKYMVMLITSDRKEMVLIRA